MPSDKSPRRFSSEVRDKDGEPNRRRRLQDALPLETSPPSDTKPLAKEVSHASDRTAEDPGERINHSNPTAVPRSQSFFQHDDRGTAARDGRRSGRGIVSERGWQNNSRDDERPARRLVDHDPKDKEKPGARHGDSHAWRHDRFSEVDVNTPAKKRRQFREEKPPPESAPVGVPAPQPSKDTHPSNSTMAAGRREERDRDRRPLDRTGYDRSFVRERSFSNRGRLEKADFSSRDRYSGGGYDGKYRGRDRFGGGQEYRSSGGRVEKWKHDMFDEANESSSHRTEEDPVAKVEALLSL